MKPTILLVDDDLDLREVFSECLSEAYHVLLAESADAAAKLVLEHGKKLSLVLTDMHMPGGSGADLARGLKASGASVPIVIMTGDVGLDGKLYENVPALAILDKVSFVAMPSEIVASFFASAWPPRAAASPYPPLIARP